MNEIERADSHQAYLKAVAEHDLNGAGLSTQFIFDCGWDAAIAALRESKPAAWMWHHPRFTSHLVFHSVKQLGYTPRAGEGWTETPLYALPILEGARLVTTIK